MTLPRFAEHRDKGVSKEIAMATATLRLGTRQPAAVDRWWREITVLETKFDLCANLFALLPFAETKRPIN